MLPTTACTTPGTAIRYSMIPSPGYSHLRNSLSSNRWSFISDSNDNDKESSIPLIHSVEDVGIDKVEKRNWCCNILDDIIMSGGPLFIFFSGLVLFVLLGYITLWSYGLYNYYMAVSIKSCEFVAVWQLVYSTVGLSLMALLMTTIITYYCTKSRPLFYLFLGITILTSIFEIGWLVYGCVLVFRDTYKIDFKSCHFTAAGAHLLDFAHLTVILIVCTSGIFPFLFLSYLTAVCMCPLSVKGITESFSKFFRSDF